MTATDPKLSYAEFRQACRAFKPSELVPALARESAALGEPPYSDEVRNRRPPWGIAATARESILFGNEHRSKPVTVRDINKLMHSFQIAADVSDEEVESGDFLLSMTTRLTHEQMPYQESVFEEVARSHAWLVEGLDEVPTDVITEQALAEMLGGISLREAIGATFVLQIGAFENEGRYNPSWLDQSNFVDVLALYPRHTIETVAARLTATPDEFKAAYLPHSVGSRTTARFDYNPLVATPFIDFDNGRPPVAPAARLILRTVSPGAGLRDCYHAGWFQPSGRHFCGWESFCRADASSRCPPLPRASAGSPPGALPPLAAVGEVLSAARCHCERVPTLRRSVGMCTADGTVSRICCGPWIVLRRRYGPGKKLNRGRSGVRRA